MPKSTENKTLYLVDGTAQLFRAYFAIRGLSTKAGLPTNAVLGFTNMLRKLIQDEAPELLAIAFDMRGPTFRKELFSEYKANRPPAPEDLHVQLPYAKQACEVLGSTVLEKQGFEADDVIATYTRRAREVGMQVVIVASDKDLYQLVGDGVTLLNPAKNLHLDVDGVTREFGVPPARVRDVLGLMGDAVDNIPGVPGVGEKTALGCVGRYGELESVVARATRFVGLFDARDALLEALAGAELQPELGGQAVEAILRAAESLGRAIDDFRSGEPDDETTGSATAVLTELGSLSPEALRGGVGQPGKKALRPLAALKRGLKSMEKGSARKIWYAIHEHADQARLSRELATLHEEVPIEPAPAELLLTPPDREAAHALFSALEFGPLSEQFSGEPPEPHEAPDSSPPAVEFELIDSPDSLQERLAACVESGRLALHAVSQGSHPLRDRLIGLALAGGDGAPAYVPLAHEYLGAPDQLAPADVAAILQPAFADPKLEKPVHDLKRHAHLLAGLGLAVEGWGLDTMVAGFLLAPGASSYELEALALEYLGQLPSEEGTPGEDEVQRIGRLSSAAASATLRLADVLAGRLDELELRELYDRVDGPLLPLLAKMEGRGIAIDTKLLAQMSEEMERLLVATRGRIHELAGTEFNVDSPKQLREVLFVTLGLRPRRKTAKSKVASTDAQTLEELAEEHAIAREILEYRELAKLKGTYVDALPRLVDERTGRVHTSYHPTGAATGRLSSSDPNLQNIPARSEAGRKIRAAFVPGEGCGFLASDYSQVELRILAHLSGDEAMLAAFRAGEDIHRYTAARVFGIPPDLVTDTMRTRAKAVNFGILYGMSEMRLAREQGMKRADAREFIRSYFDRFSRVREYIDAVRETALRDAAVRTLFGRIRFFPQLHQKVNRAIQEQSLRAAVNTTIQGTAADLMKMAMLEVEQGIRESGLRARVLLQVHDELLLEVPEGEIEALAPIVRDRMENVYSLDAPLVVDQKVGASWLEVT